MLNIGIDLGGTGIKAGLVDEKGNILYKLSCPTLVERGHEAVIHDMAQLSLRVIAESGHDLSEVASIGIGIPGIMDQATGVVPFCTNLAWHNVPLVKLLQQEIDKPVYVNNDATVAGLAESVAGVSAGTRSSVFVTLGTGVGGGVILDGKVFEGKHGVASEIGHMITVVGGELCTCGNRGCWERYASASALTRETKAAMEQHHDSLMWKIVSDIDHVNAKTSFDAAEQGDVIAKQVLASWMEYVGCGIANVINTFQPEVICIGGGVSNQGEVLLAPVRAYAEKETQGITSGNFPKICACTLRNDAGVIGAATLAGSI